MVAEITTNTPGSIVAPKADAAKAPYAPRGRGTGAPRGGGDRKGGNRGGRRERREKPEFDSRMLELARVTRVVKGGRRFRFRATIVIGNRKGLVGVGVAKGADVSEAVRKATEQAKKGMITINFVGATIPHEVHMKEGSAKVMLKPGRIGKGVVAGGAMRAVVELAGIKDIVAKSFGSSNALNVARATMKALGTLTAVAPVVAPAAAPAEVVAA